MEEESENNNISKGSIFGLAGACVIFLVLLIVGLVQ